MVLWCRSSLELDAISYVCYHATCVIRPLSSTACCVLELHTFIVSLSNLVNGMLGCLPSCLCVGQLLCCVSQLLVCGQMMEVNLGNNQLEALAADICSIGELAHVNLSTSVCALSLCCVCAR